VYGGKVRIDLPLWYGTDSVSVFNTDTVCSQYTASGSNTVFFGNQQTDVLSSVSTMILTYYEEQASIILRCTNYNNPIYRKEYTGF
jgi:hypothetical protein